MCQANAECLLCAGGSNGVGKIVDPRPKILHGRSLGGYTVAEVHPGLRILLDEERAAANITIFAHRYDRKLPRIPSRGSNRVCGRADGEQIKDHVLAVRVPAVGQETTLRRPAV